MGLCATCKCPVHPFQLVVLRNNHKVTVKEHEHISGVQYRAVTGGILWYRLMMLLLYMADKGVMDQHKGVHNEL